MNQTKIETYKGEEKPTDLKRLPSTCRTSAARLKYAEAVALYAATDLSICRVAEKCGVTASGLTSHIRKYHRDLLFDRYGLDINDESLKDLKVKPPRGQSLMTHLKYKEAIEACGDIAYIEYNVSQIAREFKLNGTALSAQLRVHYPDVIPNREKLRRRLGIADNSHRGPRPGCVEAYREALQLYRDTDMTVAEVSEKCNVSKSGLCQYLRFYHKEIIEHKAARRKAAVSSGRARKQGELSGNGQLYGPRPETTAQYTSALELYHSSGLTIDQVIEKTGVPAAGFKGYLNQWFKSDSLYRKSTALKYAPAIASLRENPRHVSAVAAEYGLNPDVFRQYLVVHEPDLVAAQGMTRRPDGKKIKLSSSRRYEQAIHEYATTPEPLKSIARRHGLVYNSLIGYIIRNCPEERIKHQKMVEAEADTTALTR